MSNLQRLLKPGILKPERHFQPQGLRELLHPVSVVRSIEFRCYRTAFFILFDIAYTPGLCPVQTVNMVIASRILIELVAGAPELKLSFAYAPGWN
ncbi:hypothetical protein D3C79_994740 [compost metagenome]